MERFNLFSLQFALCKSSLHGVHSSSLQHASHHYCFSLIVKRRKAAVAMGSLPSPKSFPNGGWKSQKINIYSRGFHQTFKLLLKQEALKTYFSFFLIETHQLGAPLPSRHLTPIKFLSHKYCSLLNGSSTSPSQWCSWGFANQEEAGSSTCKTFACTLSSAQPPDSEPLHRGWTIFLYNDKRQRSGCLPC